MKRRDFAAFFRPLTMEKPVTKKVSLLFFLGIVFAPLIFSWFLLRKGYSWIARILGISWALFILIIMIGANPGQELPTANSVASEPIALAITPAPKPIATALPKPADPAIIRGALAVEYKEFISRNNRQFNFIETKVSKSKKGYELWAVHEYFNQYSLSIGNNGKELPEWMMDNMDRLKQAGFVKVGLKNSDRYSAAWIDIKK